MPLAANHQVISVPKHRHLTGAPRLDDLFNPQVDHVVG